MCSTYHFGQLGAELLLCGSQHGQSSSRSYLEILIILATKQHQQLHLIVSILQITVLDLKTRSGFHFQQLSQLNMCCAC